MNTHIQYCKVHRKDRHLTVEGCPGCMAEAVGENAYLRGHNEELIGQIISMKKQQEASTSGLAEERDYLRHALETILLRCNDISIAPAHAQMYVMKIAKDALRWKS